jgi:cellulose synthase/poly-beta-1,6-N-acetylglucosamine synthase-like glycosyltransferase
LESCTGEFIAIFDADFVPRNDFLKKTIPCFRDQRIGAVQTRWEHINRNYSVLTRLQALALDLHFSVEQRGRNTAACFINFNGTAGVWRKQAITDAGGWRDLTLTEDLDLSYRAQLRGWTFRYLEDVGSPAELPVEINALKSQQYRWNKGGAETARLMLPQVMRGKLPLGVKLHATAHLLNSSVYLFVLLSTILSVPFLFAQTALPGVNLTAAYGFLVALGLLTFAYVTSFYSRNRPGPYVLEYPAFLSLSLGLSLHNSIAVLRGFLGRRSAFVRTPKFNVGRKQSWRNNRYLSRQIKPMTWLEGLMTMYLGAGVILGLRMGYYGMLPFHIMATIGFGLIFYYSIRHSLLAPKS